MRDNGPVERIRIFITGGTFDKEYNELTGQLYFQDSHLPEMLRLGRARLDLEIRTLMMVASLDMSADDREPTAEHCRAAPDDRIALTHATDTVAHPARPLDGAVKGNTI